MQARQLGAYIHALVSGQPSLLEQLPWYLQRPITSTTIKPNTNARHLGASKCKDASTLIGQWTTLCPVDPEESTRHDQQP
jgi:hypothetical protein